MHQLHIFGFLLHYVTVLPYAALFPSLFSISAISSSTSAPYSSIIFTRKSMHLSKSALLSFLFSIITHPLSQFLNGILGHPLGSTFLQKWTALCREQACSDGLFGSLVTDKNQEDKGKKEKKKEKFSYRQRKICLKLKNLPFSRKQKILEGGIFYEYQ